MALLAGDDRGLTLLEFGATRLEELRELSGNGAADVVVALLDTMDARTTEGTALLVTRAVDGRDAAAVDELAGWAARQSTGLAALLADLPAGAVGAAHARRTARTGRPVRRKGHRRPGRWQPGGPVDDVAADPHRAAPRRRPCRSRCHRSGVVPRRPRRPRHPPGRR